MKLLNYKEMNYKNLSFLLVTLIIGMTANLSAQKALTKDSDSKAQSELNSSLPDLKIEVSAAQVFTNKDLKSNVPFFLIVINPTCSHCINETKLICENAELFKNVKVAFMTKKDRVIDIQEFKKKTGLDQHTEFIIGTDQADAIAKLPLSGMLPHILIYDKNRKLVKTFDGNTPIEDFKQYLP